MTAKVTVKLRCSIIQAGDNWIDQGLKGLDNPTKITEDLNKVYNMDVWLFDKK